MKTMRKALALIMALAIVMSLGITAFAASTPTYSITVENIPGETNVSIVDQTYSAYKLFNATYEGMPGESDTAGAGKVHAYTVNTDFEGFTFVTDSNTEVAEFLSGTTINKDNIIDYVAALDGSPVVINRFAQKVYAYIGQQHIAAAGTGKCDVTATTEKAVIDLSDAGAGYYLVYGTATATDAETTNPLTSALILDTANPRPSVSAKVDAPTLDKTTGGTHSETVELGQKVPFVITSEIPNMAGYETYKMVFTDTFTNGLTIAEADVSLTVGEKTFGTGGGKTPWNDNVTCVVSGQTLTVTIVDVKKDSDMTAGKAITLNYSATVDSDAIVNAKDSNSITLQYSNNPNDGNSYSTTPPKIVNLYNADLGIVKVDGADGGKKLADAQFVLYKTDNGASIADNGTNPKYYVQAPDTSYVSWTGTLEDATVRTSQEASGELDKPFQGLEAGTYYLKETVAPAGYNLMKTDVKIEIIEIRDEGSNEITHVQYKVDGQEVSKIAVNSQVTANATVKNNAGTELPTTGGMGTTLFYVVGSVMMVSALVLLITKKKMSV